MSAVYVLDPISPKALAALEARCSRVVTWHDPAAVARWPEEADGVVVRTSPMPGDMIARAKRLRIIGKHGVGVDNIDLAAAKAAGIPVVNTPGANADAVAELVLALALACARHVGSFDRGLRAGALPKPLPSGTEVAGKTIGVIGYGDVGRRVGALFARAFACPVLAYDPGLSAERIRELGAAPAATADDVIAGADIISLHVPLTSATRNLFDAERLARMRRGSILINTARGGVVDELALAEALGSGSGRPAAAGFDVFAKEPPRPDHPLLRLDNFIGLPHMGAATVEALDRVGLMVVNEVADVLSGAQPAHRVA
jgi:D-3-phosphoglycerate dehydrogenase